MHQVLFRIPLKPFSWLPDWWPNAAPIYGFAVMLVTALMVCTWLAARLARREGIDRRSMEDLAFCICLAGVIGARVVFMVQYDVPWVRFLFVWEGGLVFYGSAIGGLLGYFLGHRFIPTLRAISTWRIADVLAAPLALGLCLGRIGCLLNGCCFGNVAPPDCPNITFPLSAPPRYSLVRQGLQTVAGFTMARAAGPAVVGAVEEDSSAARSGLEAGDLIRGVNGAPVASAAGLKKQLVELWPQGQNELSLTVDRAGQEIQLPAFVPGSLGLHPTQIYESISMILLTLLLLAYDPVRRRPGEVMIIFIAGYAIHRFMNEALRNDTEPVAFGMTLSQNGSIGFLLLAIGLAVFLWSHPPATVQPV